MNRIKLKLKSLPEKPGVYLFKNSAADVLYVGKAKNLKNRIRSYFSSSHNLAPRTAQLVSQIADLEYIICDTEVESLILENNLIKKYQPRYNVLLRDDKNYQFIKIDYATQIPQIYTVRKIDDRAAVRPFPSLPSPGEEKRGRKIPQIYTVRKIDDRQRSNVKSQMSKYFGPYTSAATVKETLRLLRYIFPYCANKKVGPRSCFYYHLGRCPGVCIGKINLADYLQTIMGIERFLRGDFQTTLKALRGEMKLAAEKRLYEKAARLRDQIRALEALLQKQKIVSPHRETRDVIGLFSAGNLAAITLFQVRQGKLLGHQNFLMDNAKDHPEEEVLQSFLERYYLETSDPSKEIDLPQEVPHPEQIQKLLWEKVGTTIITVPARGRRRQLIKLAQTNAQDYLQKNAQNLGREQAILTRALFELQNKLKLAQVPLRIEAFDISNIQGTSPVGSMVVFENAKPKKSDYKRFAVRTLFTPNDAGMLREVLTRRLSHVALTRPSIRLRRTRGPLSLRERERGKGNQSWHLPDLILIDGGRAQLNTALAVLKAHKLKIPVIALAKKLEEIYVPWLKTPLRLPIDSPALQLLQRVRDEAHRFAISYHRKKRSKALLL